MDVLDSLRGRAGLNGGQVGFRARNIQLIEQESHKFYEKRDQNHIILKIGVIFVDFTL